MSPITVDMQTDHGPSTAAILASLSETSTKIRGRPDHSAFGVTFEPGDATHYEIFGVYRGMVGGQELWWIGFMSGDDGGGSAVLPIDIWLHAGYVAQKLGIKNAHSATILADLLNLVFRENQR